MDPGLLNDAIHAYARGPGRTDRPLLEFLNGLGRSEHLEQVKDLVESIQGAVFDQLWTGPSVTHEEIRLALSGYCRLHHAEINEVGIDAMMGWLVWMCWHEGLLAR